MSVIQADGTISLVNNEWEKLHGYSKEEAEGKIKYTELLYGEDSERTERYFKLRSLHPGSVPSNCDTRIVDKNGNMKHVLVTVSIIPGTKKRVVSFRDTSSLKQTEKELISSQSRLRLLSRRVSKAQEEERSRIARELHDQLGQKLAAIKIETVSLAKRLENPELGDKAKALVNLADELMGTVHRISANLRPDMLDRLGLAETVQWCAEDFERRTGISCPVEIKFRDNINSKESATAAYRIIQEALTNTSLHAKATQARIKISKSGNKLVISVADNGIGIDMSKAGNDSSLGLFGMHERAHTAGGDLSISSHPGKGTKVTVHLPL